MTRKFLTGPRLIGALIALTLAIALFVATRTAPLEVETGTVGRGPMVTTVNDLAETRVRDLYMVSAPVTGELLRVPLKPGTRVVAGETLLARIRPAEPGALDARTVAQIEANVRALESQAGAARAQVEAGKAELDLAERQLGRVAVLRQKGFVAQARLDETRAARDRARAAAQAAAQGARAASRSVDAARAALIVPGGGATGRGIVDVRAPVSGFVLSVPQESMRVVAAGTPLVAIGDPGKLELVTDLLSADAVRVRAHAPVAIEDWGGDRPLAGRVRLVEPYGFLKVSALGVEEQRVNVVIDLVEPPELWARLGHGFRATVRITTWSAPDVVRVPVGALFRSGNVWQVFRVTADGRAGAVGVEIGRIGEDWGEVRKGLAAGDRVILHPGDKVAPGVKVRSAEGQGLAGS